MKGLIVSVVLGLLSITLAGQGGLDPARLVTPRTDGWPTFNGDYSGRRHSTLTDINAANVKALSLAWISQLTGSLVIKATPLMIDGVLYVSTQDNAYAIDARTGRERWHYRWPSQGGNHLANRGLGALGETLFLETPDCHLVAINLKDGTERWHKTICDLDQFYYGSVAPVVIKNHVIAGVSGDDLDASGYLDSYDPNTGDLQWRWYAVPQKMGDPGSDTWPNEDAMRHGAGMTWQPVTYDPDLNLLYVTTGNPHPVIAHRNRQGANLFTESIVALHADSGKMVWYFQASPHDTHDWDATETAVLIDDAVNGQRRHLIAQASRNGHFFLLDRTNGRAILSTEFVKTNWSLGYDAKGQPIPNPAKEPQPDGVLVSPDSEGATNWQSPTFSPATGLFYVNAARAFSMFYLYDTSDRPLGWGGSERVGWQQSMLLAIDYKTGKARWSHPWEGVQGSGLLSTAGNLVFTGGSGNLFEALNATTGDLLWATRLTGAVSNGPITYEMDGLQYVVVAAGPSIVAFVLNR